MKAHPEWLQAQRQPASAIFIVLHKVILQLFRMLWPLILVWLFRTKKNNTSYTEWILVAVSVIVFILSLIEFWFFRYSIPSNELIIKRGLLVKRNIILPLHKIQAVHIDQNWLHRLLHLSQVSFDSPGSKNAEAKITMRKDSAIALRDYILGSGDTIEKTEKPFAAAPFFTMEPYDLVKLGLSANHLEAFFILLAFGLSVMDDIETAIGDRLDGTLSRFSEQAATHALSAVLILTSIILIISVGASFIRIILKYANFRIAKTGKGFQIQGGLINSKEKLIPFKKVQFISWKANWIRKHIPYYLLQFHSAGTSDTRRKWEINVPVTRTSLIPLLLEGYHQPLPADAPSLSIQPGFVARRTFFAGVVPSLVLAAFTFPSLGWNAGWFFLLTLYIWLSSWLIKRNFRLRISKDALQVHQAVFGEKETILLWHKIQSVKLRQSIYQRKKGLATIHIYTAGGVIRVPFISLHAAEEVRDYALFKVETGSQSWM